MKEDIIRLRQEHPHWTGARIASELGISRQRVNQVLLEAGIRTKRIAPCRFCKRCGTKLSESNLREFCNDVCKKEYSNVPLICSECDTLFWRRISSMLVYPFNEKTSTRNKKYIFCTKQCQGRFLGKGKN